MTHGLAPRLPLGFRLVTLALPLGLLAIPLVNIRTHVVARLCLAFHKPLLLLFFATHVDFHLAQSIFGFLLGSQFFPRMLKIALALRLSLLGALAFARCLGGAHLFSALPLFLIFPYAQHSAADGNSQYGRNEDLLG